jgi:hypothetical protein
MGEVLLRLNISTSKKIKTDFSIPILLSKQKIKSIFWIPKIILQPKAKKRPIKVMLFKIELKKSSQDTILR